jgi:hypothetical protein
MYHVTETRKQNLTKSETIKHANEATFASLANGSVLLKCAGRLKTIAGAEASAFVEKVRNLNPFQVKTEIEGIFG